MIISARLPANLSRTRLKSSCGQRNVRLAALRMMVLVYQWLENGVSFKINDWQERRKKCYLEFLYCVLTFPVFFILRCLPLTKSNSFPYSSLKYDARQIKISQATLKPEIFSWLQLLVIFPLKLCTENWRAADKVLIICACPRFDRCVVNLVPQLPLIHRKRSLWWTRNLGTSLLFYMHVSRFSSLGSKVKCVSVL